MKSVGGNKFGTFQGVFVPTLLTILGIILFLRLPWVVGNAGILGATIIILIAVAITFLTSLSLSSIVTNIRIGPGGAFSIISRSLGLEIGGSIGIPLYLSQAIAVAMYIFGFRAGWLWIFPNHDPLLVDLCAFVAMFSFAFLSTSLAFKVQYGIMAIVLIAIGSIVAGYFKMDEHVQPELIGDFVEANENELIGANFWAVFAVFFPAVTGVMAGLNMSGELKNPRKSIPKGTLLAVVLTSLIYIGLAIMAGFMGGEGELRSNYNFFIDKSAIPILVLVGLLGATFSSALTSFVGAPRVLFAIAKEGVIPNVGLLNRTNKKEEPTGALLFTGAIVLLAIFLRDLNIIAPLITMFFLITYAMINAVVLIEQSLSLPSFRPTFSVPIIIPLLGVLGCLIIMFIVNPIFSVISIIAVILFYAFFSRKQFTNSGGYARSGLFTAMAEWASKKARNITPDREPRAWQPDLLFPIQKVREIKSCYKLVYAITHPKGSLRILGVGEGEEAGYLKKELPAIVKAFPSRETSVSFSLLESNEFGKSVEIGTEALGAAIFKPNTLFLYLDQRMKNLNEYKHIIETAKKHEWGVLVYVSFAKVGIGLEQSINLWLRHVPPHWDEDLELGNNDLALIISLLIHKNWKGQLNIIFETAKKDKADIAWEVEKLKSNTRLPKNSQIQILNEDQEEKWKYVPPADLNIVSTPQNLNMNEMTDMVKRYRSSFLFALDSGKENAQL